MISLSNSNSLLTFFLHKFSDEKFYRLSRGHKHKCADYGKQFSVRKGALFEKSALPQQKWLAAIWRYPAIARASLPLNWPANWA